jgi:hypothetical protein
MLAFDGTLVIQSFFKARTVLDSRASNENISSKLEYADCTENNPAPWGIHFRLSLVSILGWTWSNTFL